MLEKSEPFRVVIERVDHRILLVNQFRHGANHNMWVLPGGLAESNLLLYTIAAEVMSNLTGIEVNNNFRIINKLYLNPETSRQEVIILHYQMTGTERQVTPQINEEYKWLSKEKVDELVRFGVIHDPITAVGLLMVL